VIKWISIDWLILTVDTKLIRVVKYVKYFKTFKSSYSKTF